MTMPQQREYRYEPEKSRTWAAEWIWHPQAAPENAYVYFRRSFSLEGAPLREARLFVSASARYQLFVNGRYVGRGPNPTDPGRYYYDVYEAADLLREGANVIAALGYAFRPEPGAILRQNWGRGGFLLEAELDGRSILATDGSWKTRLAPTWDPKAPINCTLLGDYKEIQDLRKALPGWTDSDFDDADWDRPEFLGKPPVAPWTRLVEREIPTLGGERVYPVNVAWESASVTYAHADDWEVYADQLLAPDGTHQASRAEEGVVRVAKTHEDFPPALTLDFGHEVTGYPIVEIEDGADGAELDLLYAEDLFFVRVDQFVLRDGPQTLEPFNRRSFRYLKILFRRAPREIKLKSVSTKLDVYPFERNGSFASSDERLDRIWDVGRRTIRMSSLDHFVDCPWREQTLYGGDLYAENLIAHYAFGDPRLNRKCLRQFFHLQFESGGIPPWGPYRECPTFYPAWAAFTGITLVDHYWLTGERELVDELWPKFAKLTDWAKNLADGDPLGIGGAAPKREPGAGRHISYEDWMAAKRDVYAPSQILPVYALLDRAAELAKFLGREDEARRWSETAGCMANGIREHLIDRETGLLPGRQRAAPGAFGRHENALLLWTGLLSEGAGRAVADKLFDDALAPIQAPFHGLFVLLGLLRYGRDELAVSFARNYWGGMLDRGATTYWDNFSTQWPEGKLPNRQTSLCHGWAAAPTHVLPAWIAGLRPLEPGFRRVLVEPRPGGLAWAGATVPTPFGPVGATWRAGEGRFELEVAIPEGAEAVLSLPAAPESPRAFRLDGAVVEARREGFRLLVEVGPGRHRAEVA